MYGKESSNPVSYQLPRAVVHLGISRVQSLNPTVQMGQMTRKLLPVSGMSNNLFACISLHFPKLNVRNCAWVHNRN